MTRRRKPTDIRGGIAIGPCRDPLRLWFIEWTAGGRTWRRYYADRAEARAARTARLKGTR